MIALVLSLGTLFSYAIWRAVDRPTSRYPYSRHGFGDAERRLFTVLRGATQPIPSGLRRRLRRARSREISTLLLGRARYLATDAGLWIVNGPGRTCIIRANGGAVSCEPRATFLKEGVSLGVVRLGTPPDHKAREFIVVGVVPNHVRSVDLEVGDRMRIVAAHDNGYSLHAPVPIVVERFDG